MNNNIELVKAEKKKSALPSFGNAPVVGNISQSNDSIGAANNALNTFRTITASNNNVSSLSQLLEMNNNTKKEDSSNTKDGSSLAMSDERCKELFGSTDLVDAIAGIDAYRFKYKEGAENINPSATPDKTHYGIMAQDLAANPVTQSAVVEDTNGFLEVDTRELALTTFAIVTQMAKKIEQLEEKLK